MRRHLRSDPHAKPCENIPERTRTGADSRADRPPRARSRHLHSLRHFQHHPRQSQSAERRRRRRPHRGELAETHPEPRRRTQPHQCDNRAYERPELHASRKRPGRRRVFIGPCGHPAAAPCENHAHNQPDAAARSLHRPPHRIRRGAADRKEQRHQRQRGVGKTRLRPARLRRRLPLRAGDAAPLQLVPLLRIRAQHDTSDRRRRRNFKGDRGSAECTDDRRAARHHGASGGIQRLRALLQQSPLFRGDSGQLLVLAPRISPHGFLPRRLVERAHHPHQSFL